MITTFEFAAAWIRARFGGEEGASLVEYALLLALIAVVCIAAIFLIGTEADKTFDSIGGSLSAANAN
jgi:pilus assembly protein Flp/PilA